MKQIWNLISVHFYIPKLFRNLTTMNVLSVEQQRWLDRYTIEHEPISSLDLMERAALRFFIRLRNHLHEKSSVIVFCGSGNNGGDGFGIARLLIELGISTDIYVVPFGKLTADCGTQYERVKDHVMTWKETSNPSADHNTIIIDALLGIGSGRKPEGILESAISWINHSICTVVSVDIPSGLPCDQLPDHETIVKAHFTFAFHAPKLTFFLPETAPYCGEWEVLDIGLDQAENARQHSQYAWLKVEEVQQMIPKRKRFSHKGTYGHGLLVAGSIGKFGACILSSKAALRSGIGLLSVYTVASAKSILPVAVPEAMGIFDEYENEISGLATSDLGKFSALAIGPGSGNHEGVLYALRPLIQSNLPLVIDADALNVLAEHEEWKGRLHEQCVLTPHPKEFERLAGASSDSLDRLSRLSEFATSRNCVVVLKDAITAVATPDGKVYFNTTGNCGMATGGSGDVLTGIILGLLAQKIPPAYAAKIAVFHHGLAGDKVRTTKGERALIAGDLIEALKIE